MPLPEFNNQGDLPPGVHSATIEEVRTRFGSGLLQRQRVTARLVRLYDLAISTAQVQRLLLFGSYITDKPTPNDVDVVLVMQNTFDVTLCNEEVRPLFDHQLADQEFGASVFWIRPALLFLETLDEFIAHWQVKRDGSHRGLVEIVL